MATEILYPTSDLAGDWELTQPLPVVEGYTRPMIVGTDSAGYAGGDQAGDAAIPDALQLPEIAGLQPAGVELIGFWVSATDETYRTNHTAQYPSVTIEAGDLVEIITGTFHLFDPGAITSSGFTELGDWRGVDYQPNTTILYEFAAGSESGSITVTAATSCRMDLQVRVWRGVDQTTPYDGVTPAETHGYGHPNPAATDSAVSAGAVVVVVAIGNVWGGLADAVQSSGFTKILDTSSEDRSFADCYKVSESGGVVDPSAYTWNVGNYTTVTYALRGATGTDLVAFVATGVADGTATAELSSGVELPAVDEVQTITSVLTSGTFTLTFEGQTTASINWNDSAATVDTRLEALSNVAAGDVVVTGGPLNENPVVVTFANNLAASDRSLITTSSGNVTVDETTRGRAQEAFTFEGSHNIPPTGGSNYGPQIHLWSKLVSDYMAGDPIDIVVADHDTLHSWAAVLLIVQGALTSNPISDTFGSENAGSGSSGTFGSITPAAAGSVILAMFGKGKSSLYSGTAPSPSSPARFPLAAQALGDGTTLSVFASGPVAAVAEQPSGVSWGGGTEFYATGLIALTPAVAAGGSTLAAATGSEDETTYIELGHAAGSLFEVLELDADAIPADAVITSVFLEVHHESSVSNSIRAVLCGINGDDTIELCNEDGARLVPAALGSGLGTPQTSTTAAWGETASGTPLYEFDRFGVALISAQRHPQLTSHKVYWARAVVDYIEGGPIVDSVSAPSSPGDSIGWSYSSAGGLPQAGYEIKVLAGSAQDPTVDTTPAVNDLDPATGEHYLSTGFVAGPSTRSVLFTDRMLGRGTCTYAVRVFARLPGGTLVPSDWLTADSNISGTPTAGGTQSTDPVFNEATGAVDLALSTGASQVRAWVARSDDSGATYRTASGSPFTLTASTSDQAASDVWAPLGASVRYQVSFDNGAHTESSSPVQVGADSDHSTIHDRWYLIVPDQPALSVGLPNGKDDPVVANVTGPLSPRRSVVSEQEGGAVVAVSGLLPVRMSLTVRTLSKSDREAVEALLGASLPIRVVDVFGREWLMRETSGVGQEIMIIEPVSTETTAIRDAHTTVLNLIEIAQ